MILFTMLLLCILMICFALGLVEMDDIFWLDDVYDDDDSIPWSEIEEEMRQQLSSLGAAIMGIFTTASDARSSVDRASSGSSLPSLGESEVRGDSGEEEKLEGEENVYTQVLTDSSIINVTNPLRTHLDTYGAIP